MLTLTFSAPIAAYSTAPRLQHRLTDDRPSRTAILGLLRCAMGIPRDVPSPDLDALTITVQDASYAERSRDFHTIRNAITYDGSPGRNAITTRHYLTESCATVNIQGPAPILNRIQAALAKPYWQLYLGRRSCVPDRPVLQAAAMFQQSVAE